MSDHADFRELVTSLYDCALSQDMWPSTLEKLCPIVNARSSILFAFDQFKFDHQSGYHIMKASPVFEINATDKYIQDYSAYEQEHIRIVLESEPGTMITNPEFENRIKIKKRPDVSYVMEHFGILDRFGIRLNDHPAWADCLAFQYPPHRSVASKSEYELFIPYIKHVAKSVAMGRMFDSIRRRYQAVLSMLDRVKVSMLLTRPDGGIVVCNETAKATIEANPLIRISKRGKLEGCHHDTNRDIHHHIKDVSKTSDGVESISSRFLKIGDSSENNDILLEFSPLRDSEMEIERGLKGAFIVIVDPNRSYSIHHQALHNLYALSPAESEVAQLIADGQSTKTIAEKRNVSHETVRTQIKSIYSKSGTKNRAELIRNLLSISLPFED